MHEFKKQWLGSFAWKAIIEFAQLLCKIGEKIHIKVGDGFPVFLGETGIGFVEKSCL